MASLAAAERFDMGRVVNRAFGVIGRNLPLFLMLAVLLRFIPALLLRAFMTSAIRTPGAGLATAFTLMGTGLFSIFLSYLMQATVNYATVTDLDGQRPVFAKSLMIGLKYALPLLLMAIVSVIAIYAGLILLLVPGLILALMWSVATPAMVSEGLGVFASLGRSRALTKGHRWAIFGLLLVVALLTFVPLLLVPLLSGAFSNPAAYQASPFGPAQIINAGLSMLVSMLFAVIIAAIYVELRTIKEGATPESLAQIFA